MPAFRAITGKTSAVLICGKAEQVYAHRFGTEHLLYANALQNHALGLFEAGRLSEAERKMDVALAIYRKVLDTEHPVIADGYLMTGRIRAARGDSSGAAAAFSLARTIFIHLYGPNNPAVADADFYLAQAESDGGNAAGALQLLAQTKRIYDASYGPIDPDQVELLTARMKVYRAAHRITEARADCAAAVALQTKIEPRSPHLGPMRALCAVL
jgi:tetratricopeptide (TPR) repeat protein